MPCYAVFTEQHEMLGWLDDPSDEFAKLARPEFQVRTIERGKWTVLSDWAPYDVRHNRRDEADLWPKVSLTRFRMQMLCVARDDSGIWSAQVLVHLGNKDDLNKLPRFKWFAEEYGTFTPAPQRARAK